jgi:hypothetical protein
MLLRVKNLGPVREAELDLSKPLIVLTGPNNSGETYLAWAAYSLARLDSRSVQPPDNLREWAKGLLSAPGRSLELKSLVECRNSVLEAMADAVKKRLSRDFAAPQGRFEDTKIELLSTSEENSGFLALNGQLAGRGLNLHEITFDARDQRLYLSIKARERQADGAGLTYEPSSMLDDIAQVAMLVLMHHFSERRHIAFPVERLAINLFARELAAESRELVDELLSVETATSSPATLREKLRQGASRYPRAIHDAIQRAIRGPDTSQVSRFANLADELEESVLKGSIRIDAYNDVRFVPNQDVDKKPLGLHETASVVKSLVSLVVHLRHEAHPGQRLVIDEPELNLHPDNQRLIARILAKAVNRGLKIMMSTHSDYVIRELNNLVMLGQDSEKARSLAQELGYQPEQTLRREQIGAYLVNDGACTPLEVDETGFSTKTIEDEIHKLNQDAQTIYFRLFED